MEDLRRLSRLLKEGKYNPNFFAGRQKRKKILQKSYYKFSESEAETEVVECINLIGLDENHNVIGIETPEAEVWYLISVKHGNWHVLTREPFEGYIQCNCKGEKEVNQGWMFGCPRLTMGDKKSIMLVVNSERE